MDDNKLLRFLVICGDFVVTYAVIMLFAQLTTFAEVWTVKQLRVFLMAVFLGMAIAQLRFSALVHKSFISVDLVMRNTTWLILVSCVCTYLLMRLYGTVGVQTGFWLIWIAVADWVALLLVRAAAIYLWPSVLRRFGHQRGVLFVGQCPAASGLWQWLRHTATYRWCKMYYYADTRDTALEADITYLGSMADFRQLMVDATPAPEPISEVFCIMPRTQRRTMEHVANWCDRHVLRFFYVPERAEELNLSLTPVLLDDHEIYTRYESPLLALSNRCIKRLFDIVFSFLAIIPITLALPFFAWRIKRESPGPIFFAQDRTGYGGRTFKCLKFRSMHVNNDSDTQQATEDDPRKFPFGDFMRRTNLDELPQFFNVFIGDMSVVGPRPHMLHHTDIYGSKIHQYMARHFIRPGITGWAQVTGWRGETQTDDQMEGRIDCDLWYLEHWTFWLDLRIILKTIKTIFMHDEHAY